MNINDLRKLFVDIWVKWFRVTHPLNHSVRVTLVPCRLGFLMSRPQPNRALRSRTPGGPLGHAQRNIAPGGNHAHVQVYSEPVETTNYGLGATPPEGWGIPVRSKAEPGRALGAPRAHVKKFCLDAIGMDDPTAEAGMRDLFAHFDLDQDGYIDREEFKGIMQHGFEHFGAPMSDRDISRLFARLDVNRSGKLSFDEFCVVLLSRLRL
jgi:hypothetical protein